MSNPIGWLQGYFQLKKMAGWVLQIPVSCWEIRLSAGPDYPQNLKFSASYEGRSVLVAKHAAIENIGDVVDTVFDSYQFFISDMMLSGQKYEDGIIQELYNNLTTRLESRITEYVREERRKVRDAANPGAEEETG